MSRNTYDAFCVLNLPKTLEEDFVRLRVADPKVKYICIKTAQVS